MPLPNPAILNAFLATYKQIREPTWNSLTNMAKAYAGRMAGQDIRGDRISECDQLELRFNTAENTRDWFEIIHELDEKAHSAGKQAKLDSSLFSETLHAVRSYIIAMLKFKPKTNLGDKTSTENTIDLFDAEIIKLLAEKEKIKEKILQNRQRCADQSVIDGLKETHRQVLMKLVHLNHDLSIYEAGDLGLLTTFICPTRIDRFNEKSPFHTSEKAINDSINPNIPWYYQRAYYFIFYEKSFFEFKRKEFRAFLTEAVKNAPKKSSDDIEAILLDEASDVQELDIEDMSLEETQAAHHAPEQTSAPIEPTGVANMPVRFFRRPSKNEEPPASSPSTPEISHSPERQSEENAMNIDDKFLYDDQKWANANRLEDDQETEKFNM